MSTLVRKNRSFWPKMMQDFFGTENPFELEENFGFMEKSAEIPSANVIENDHEFKVELSAPGFEKKDFKVEVLEGVLNISAEKKNEVKEEKDNYMKKEFSYSSIRRSFALPEYVDENKIDAKYEKGILNLILPKKALNMPKAKKAIEVV